MSKYSVNTPGFLDLPASKRVSKQAGKPANEQTSEPTSKSATGGSKRARAPKRRSQLSLNGFDSDLHTRFAIAAQQEGIPMVRLAETVIEEWLERG